MSRSKRNAAAEDYFKRAPNYSAEAIDALVELSKREDIPIAARISGLVADMLTSAHKFTLPDYGVITDAGVKEWWFDRIRLPFPVVALEFDAPPKLPEARVRGDKRVVLAWEKDGPAGEPVVSVLPLAWSSKSQRWIPYLAFIELPCESRNEYAAALVPFGEPGRLAMEKYSDKDAKQIFLKESAMEIAAVADFCAAMACTNVSTDIIRPNREARAARPASTLFDYHVLMIRAGAEHQTSEDKGGTHASPRTHLRRGHIRRLAWGPRVWVNSCVVNPSAIGTVNKDYRVKG